MKRLFGFIAFFFLAASPAVAVAHEGNANYRSEINSIRPSTLAPGFEVTVVNFDDHVRMVNESGKDVVILGYNGEPLARILADGAVEENLNSPSYYLNQDRFAEVDIPDRADKDAAPDWQQVGANGIYEWHDHRSHYMGQGTPDQVTDESKETKVFDYSIPIEVDGEPAKVNGTLFWAGKDSTVPVIPFVILGLAVIAAAGFWIARRRRDREAEADPDAKEQKEAW